MFCEMCENEIFSRVCRNCGTVNASFDKNEPRKILTEFDKQVIDFAERYTALNAGYWRLYDFFKATASAWAETAMNHHAKRIADLKIECGSLFAKVKAHCVYFNRPLSEGGEFKPRRTGKIGKMADFIPNMQ